ncbi:MlaD family protein [Oceaniglobus roseus]|uniref:MlaD family protein n=1 Tax=Oceaniglobus roseus TaxID=1737570 RepID=UPI000C7F12BA|nr:MlaD family protein [Kandeliimicrobium roseum]
METRANFILIGAFTLAALAGALAFFVWLASVQIDRQYATYGILFDDVSGLDPSGAVLFNGIPVGQVIGLRIYEKDPSKVFTTIEVDATVPVRADTVAQLQSQGVTGVAYISLSGGTPEAPLLEGIDGELPIIPSRRSTVQVLVEDAPDLLAETAKLLRQLQLLTGTENQAYVSNILRNLAASSERLDQALADFTRITDTVGTATQQITRFTDRLDSIGAAVETTLQGANGTLASAQRAFDAASTTLTSSAGAVARIEGTFAEAESLLATRVPGILDEVAQTVTDTRSAIADLQAKTGGVLDGFGQTAGLLNTRLAELENTLLNANTAFVAVTEASDTFDTLVDGDGTLMVAEARDVLADAKSAIGGIDAVVRNDLPGIVADVRGAVSRAAAAVDRVAADVTGLTGQFDPIATDTRTALASANQLLTRARGSLDGLDTALANTKGALASAERAFDTADGLMRTDLAPVLEDVRTASARIGAAVEDVARDVPAIAADLRALIARTDALVGDVQRAVDGAAPGIGEFSRTGLPELTRLGTEARGLVSTLDSLVRKLGRDPARFLLDNRVPEYRR